MKKLDAELIAWIDDTLAEVTTGHGEATVTFVLVGGHIVRQIKHVIVSKRPVDSVRRPR